MSSARAASSPKWQAVSRRLRTASRGTFQAALRANRSCGQLHRLDKPPGGRRTSKLMTSPRRPPLLRATTVELRSSTSRAFPRNVCEHHAFIDCTHRLGDHGFLPNIGAGFFESRLWRRGSECVSATAPAFSPLFQRCILHSLRAVRSRWPMGISRSSSLNLRANFTNERTSGSERACEGVGGRSLPMN